MKKNKIFWILVLLSPILNVILLRGQYWLFPIVFVPFFLVILTHYKDWKKLILNSLTISIIPMFGGFFWIYQDYKFNFFLAILESIVFFAFISIVVALIFKKTSLSKFFYLKISLIPGFLWYLQLHILSLSTYGSFLFEYGVFLNSPGKLAYLLGIKGVTFLVIALNFIIAVLFMKLQDYKSNKTSFSFKNSENSILIVLFVLLIFVISFNFQNDSSEEHFKVKVAAIQPNIDEEWELRQMKYNTTVLDLLLSLSKQAADDGAEIILWPEYAIPVDFINNKEEFRNRILDFANEYKVNLIIGTIDFNPKRGQHLDIALFVNSEGEILGQSSSIKPAPREQSVYVDGKKKTIAFNISGNKVNILTLMCFEEFFLIDKSFLGEANLLGVLSNDRDTGSGIHLASLYARYRAAENGLPLVRSVNTGISQIIDSSGKVLSILDANKKGYVIQEITLKMT